MTPTKTELAAQVPNTSRPAGSHTNSVNTATQL